tara:strand:- start:532 stop:1881 length:1350 start_codon:yes stop_codon:yes gene_type:complete
MKKLAIALVGIFLISFSAKATPVASEDYNPNRYDGKAYIFIEGGVEFSIFPDGQFDFAYVGPVNGTEVTISAPGVNVSFNSGYDYDMYVQYDDYGAVLQVEDVPIYYDEFGRITQAGSVDIQYNDRRIVRVGGLYINYDHYGYYRGYTGYINVYNRFYVPRPWHVFYVRPVFASCIVYDFPYRRYYTPVRYSYHHHRNYYKNRHNVAYSNARRSFHRPGSRIHYKGGRTTVNKSYNPNRRNTMIAQGGRRDNASNSRGVAKANNRGTAKTSTTRGVAKKDDRGTARNGKTSRATSSRGVAKKDDRGTARNGNTSRATSSRGVAKKDTRATARKSNGNRTASTRGIANRTDRSVVKKTSRTSSNNRKTVRKSSTRKTVARSSTPRKATTTRPQQKRSTASRSSGSSAKRTTAKRTQKATAKRSTNTRTKSVSRSGSTKSRANTSSRGRGN